MDTNDQTTSLASIGIDIGKEVFHLVGFWRRRQNCGIMQEMPPSAGTFGGSIAPHPDLR